MSDGSASNPSSIRIPSLPDSSSLSPSNNPLLYTASSSVDSDVRHQIQPVLHNSLLQSPFDEQREFITGIHTDDVEYSENNKSDQNSADDKSVGRIGNISATENTSMQRDKSITTRQHDNFRDYLLKKLDSRRSENGINGNCNNDSSQFLESLSSSNLKSVKSHAQLAKTAQGVRILAKNLNRATIKLQLKSVMIVTKARDNNLIYLTRELAEWLLSKDQIDVFVDYHLESSKRFDAPGLLSDYSQCKSRLKYWTKELVRKNPDMFDLVLTLGGDGTVLYVSTLFQRVVPPVMSFSLGSLGFLTNFKFEDFRGLLDQVLRKGVKTNLRMRFTCRVHKLNGDLVCEQQVLNEIVIDRGPSPWVSMLELYGDGSLLTVAQADGLILATPTGSTAYSLSANGSLVHPGVSAISVTPICPHTLSFRPILLPDSMTLTVKVPLRSRSNAWCSFDGRSRIELQKGDYVTVVASPFPFPTVRSSKTEFIDSVSRILNWNVREEQKSFVHLLSDKNKQLFNKHNNEKHKRSRAYHHSRAPVFEVLGADDDDEEDDDDDDDVNGKNSGILDEEDETDSINSIDYHQAYFEDNEKYNCQEGDENCKHKNTHQVEDQKFDIDYSDSETDTTSATQTKKVKDENNKFYKNSKLARPTNSASTIEIDDTTDYVPGNIYKPKPEDEIHTPILERELPLLDQVKDHKSLEASQIIAGELIDNLNRLDVSQDR